MDDLESDDESVDTPLICPFLDLDDELGHREVLNELDERSTTKRKDKGKGIMEESESAMTKKKRQQKQERLGHEAAVGLQEEFDEKERQRIARVHEAAQTFIEEEWQNIKARVKADEELT
nr:hypothetical protein [Tanacetum cinerariifolium]